MTFTNLGDETAYNGPTSGGTLTFATTLLSDVIAGDLVIIFWDASATGTTISSCSDDGGLQTYDISSCTPKSANTHSTGWILCRAVAGGFGTTITVTLSGSVARRGGSLLAFRPSNANWQLDAQVGNVGDASSPVDTPLTGTLAQADELAVACWGVRLNAPGPSGFAQTTPAGWTNPATYGKSGGATTMDETPVGYKLNMGATTSFKAEATFTSILTVHSWLLTFTDEVADVTDSGTVTFAVATSGTHATRDAATNTEVIATSGADALRDAGTNTLAVIQTGADALADAATNTLVVVPDGLLVSDYGSVSFAIAVSTPISGGTDAATVSFVIDPTGVSALAFTGTATLLVTTLDDTTGAEALADATNTTLVVDGTATQAASDAGTNTLVVTQSDASSFSDAGTATVGIDGSGYLQVTGLIQQHSTPAATGTQDVIVETFDQPAGVGNALFVVAAANENTGPNTINTPAGWTRLAEVDGPGGTDLRIVVFGKIAAGGETSVTVTFNAQFKRTQTAFAEFAGYSTLLDGAISSASSTPLVLTGDTGTATPTGANRLWLGAVAVKNHDPITNPAGFSVITVNNEVNAPGVVSINKMNLGVWFAVPDSDPSRAQPTWTNAAARFQGLGVLFMPDPADVGGFDLTLVLDGAESVTGNAQVSGTATLAIDGVVSAQTGTVAVEVEEGSPSAAHPEFSLYPDPGQYPGPDVFPGGRGWVGESLIDTTTSVVSVVPVVGGDTVGDTSGPSLTITGSDAESVADAGTCTLVIASASESSIAADGSTTLVILNAAGATGPGDATGDAFVLVSSGSSTVTTVSVTDSGTCTFSIDGAPGLVIDQATVTLAIAVTSVEALAVTGSNTLSITQTSVEAEQDATSTAFSIATSSGAISATDAGTNTFSITQTSVESETDATSTSFAINVSGSSNATDSGTVTLSIDGASVEQITEEASDTIVIDPAGFGGVLGASPVDSGTCTFTIEGESFDVIESGSVTLVVQSSGDEALADADACVFSIDGSGSTASADDATTILTVSPSSVESITDANSTTLTIATESAAEGVPDAATVIASIDGSATEAFSDEATDAFQIDATSDGQITVAGTCDFTITPIPGDATGDEGSASFILVGEGADSVAGVGDQEGTCTITVDAEGAVGGSFEFSIDPTGTNDFALDSGTCVLVISAVQLGTVRLENGGILCSDVAGGLWTCPAPLPIDGLIIGGTER